MPTKTITNTKNVFVRDSTTDTIISKATFHLDTVNVRKGMTRITIPAKSVYSPGLHWHETHVEFFRVIQGRVIIVRDGVEKEIGPEDGHLRVDKFVVHNFWRADKGAPDEDKDAEEVITEEWTDPADGLKHVFFRNIFSTLDDKEYWGLWLNIQALFVASHNDEFVQVVSGRLSYATTHALYAAMKVVGTMLGLKSWYSEYTPDDLRNVAENSMKGLKHE